MNAAHPEAALVILCLVGLLVLLVNAGLWFVYRRGGPLKTIETFRKAGQAASNPFKKEDQDLEELARRVEALKNPPGSPKTDETDREHRG